MELNKDRLLQKRCKEKLHGEVTSKLQYVWYVTPLGDGINDGPAVSPDSFAHLAKTSG
jgi:hypothetical protein